MAKRAKNPAAEQQAQEKSAVAKAEEVTRPPILGANVKGELRDIPLHLVVDPEGPSDRIPRPGDLAAIEQLARSIKECGQLQPVMVEVLNKGKGKSYRRVFGRRRIAAMRMLGLETVRASVVDELLPDVRRTIVAIENVQRQDLTPAEETLAVGELMALQAYTAAKRVKASMPVGPDFGRVVDDEVADRCETATGNNPARYREALLDIPKVRSEASELVAAMLGKPASWVRDRMYIGRLSDKARKLVLDGKLPLAHAREIAKMGDEKERESLAIAFAAGGDESISDEEAGPLEDLRMEVRRNVFALCEVPWKLSLPFVGKPACDGCPCNSATNPGLFEHGGGVSTTMVFGRGTYDSMEADHFRVEKTGICTLPTCYQEKLRAAKAAVSAAAKLIVDDGKKPAEAKPAAFVDDRALASKVAERRKLAGRGGKQAKGGAKKQTADEWRAEHEAERKYGEACFKIREAVAAKVKAKLEQFPLRSAVLELASEYHSSAPDKGPGLASFLKQVAAADDATCQQLILKDIEGRKLKFEPRIYSMDNQECEALASAFGVDAPVWPKKSDFTAKPEAKDAAKGKPA